ncbi:energy transducer TonB [Methylomicrobium sp. Wu6]|uniref:energy transducer TonB n=1 Tax=Methylomicrobium sp. Wu6 TaxID=3107928 RepID=UPI002DD6B5CC|nr:energy transducer TonB [Methylomicrobium sp. Wu6]MEC4748526.1 energy transducer TonB [Methylomicrobium sp. Wu6]
MQLFNSRDGGPSAPDFAYPGGAATDPHSSWQALLQALRREKRPGYLFGEIVLVVLLLHVSALLWLFAPSEPVAQAKPLMMEVSLVAAPKQQPNVAPPAPPKPPEPPKPKPKKKPVAKKKPDVRKPPKPLSKDALALPKPAETQAAEPETSPSPPAPPSPPVKTAAAPAETFTEANFRANYGFNPKPEYPRLARNRGWEGKVLLKVQVSAEGFSDSVAIHRSSGHDILDESAVAAVEKWKFIPAMRGSTAVASSVIVPIIFTLNN